MNGIYRHACIVALSVNPVAVTVAISKTWILPLSKKKTGMLLYKIRKYSSDTKIYISSHSKGCMRSIFSLLIVKLHKKAGLENFNSIIWSRNIYALIQVNINFFNWKFFRHVLVCFIRFCNKNDLFMWNSIRVFYQEKKN